eukprot:4605557-Amphidinium_carterae.1
MKLKAWRVNSDRVGPLKERTQNSLEQRATLAHHTMICSFKFGYAEMRQVALQAPRSCARVGVFRF